jgi:hypothetical protein
MKKIITAELIGYLVKWFDQTKTAKGNKDAFSYTSAGTITFVAATDINPPYITDSLSGFLTAGKVFETGDLILVSGSVSNNDYFTVAMASASRLTLAFQEDVTAETGPIGAVVISCPTTQAVMASPGYGGSGSVDHGALAGLSDTADHAYAVLIDGTRNIHPVSGMKIGTATSDLLGFYNAAPVDQPAAVADATDAPSTMARLNDLIARMRELGLIAT